MSTPALVVGRCLVEDRYREGDEAEKRLTRMRDCGGTVPLIAFTVMVTALAAAGLAGVMSRSFSPWSCS